MTYELINENTGDLIYTTDRRSVAHIIQLWARAHGVYLTILEY